MANSDHSNIYVTMRSITLAIAALLTVSVANAQSAPKKLLAIDPFQTNGYFIVDRNYAAELHATKYIVKVEGVKDGSMRFLEEVTITNGHYGKVDEAVITSLGENERFSFHVTAYNANGEVVGDPQYWHEGPIWDVACSHLCESDKTAYKLTWYTHAGQAQIELSTGTQNGQYLYFYVLDSRWMDFTQSPTWIYNMPGAWNWVEDGLYCPEVIRVTQLPPGARNEQGVPYGSGVQGAARGVYKSLGIYQPLSLNSTSIFSPTGGECIDPLYTFNHNDQIEDLYAAYILPPLNCVVMPNVGGSVSWEGPDGTTCWTESIWDYGGDLVYWALAQADCFEEENPMPEHEPGGLIHEITIFRLDAELKTVVTELVVPVGKDPKLIPVPKTELGPGLYEFRIIKSNGDVIRHYQDTEVSRTISANFASFVDLTIYPVPVTGKTFAIDLDLAIPLNCQLTILDNMGVQYHAEYLQFPLAGRNKKVIDMDTAWPNGLYHAVLQFGDGSTGSANFTVAIGQ